MLRKTFQAFSILIGLTLCLLVVLKVSNNLPSIKYDSLDFIIFLVGFACILGLPIFLSEATTLKFMDFEWRREINKVKKELRQYAILDENGNILKSTFPENEIQIKNFQNGKIDIWFRKAPIFLEIRAIGKQAAYSIVSKNDNGGILFMCSRDTAMVTINNEPIGNRYIIETYVE